MEHSTHVKKTSNPNQAPEVIDIFVGPIFTYLTPAEGASDAYCVFRVEVPAGVTVPIHSHADRETFYILSGEIEGFDGTQWRMLGAGDVLDVPGNVKHAFRNHSEVNVTLLMTSTVNMGRYYLDIGRPVTGAPLPPPTPEDLQHFAQVSKEYGYWFGDAEANAAVGITLS